MKIKMAMIRQIQKQKIIYKKKRKKIIENLKSKINQKKRKKIQKIYMKMKLINYYIKK